MEQQQRIQTMGLNVPKQLRDQRPLYSNLNFHPFNVVEAAKARIRYLLKNYDDLLVSFSGGKDSLVVLELTHQVYQELGRTDKVKFKFMDEELICDSIVNFVQNICQNDSRFIPQYYAIQMQVGFFVMGKHRKFIAWDPDRKWHRKPPPYAITNLGYDTRDHNENSISQLMFPDTSRTVVQCLGVRAQESAKRKQVMSSGGRIKGGIPNYVRGAGLVVTANPIFDWSELDVFKFFKDCDIKYCPCYDSQMWTKAPLRVASCMHERAAGQFFKMKEIEPLFYEQLRAVYPEIETHFRYWKEVDRFSVMNQYPRTFDGVRKYIREQLVEGHQKEALRYVNNSERIRRDNEVEQPDMPLGGMPVLYVFKEVIQGRFINGVPMSIIPTPVHQDFENGLQISL